MNVYVNSIFNFSHCITSILATIAQNMDFFQLLSITVNEINIALTLLLRSD